MRAFGVLLAVLIAPVFAESYAARSRKQLLKKLDHAELAGRPVLFAVDDFDWLGQNDPLVRLTNDPKIKDNPHMLLVLSQPRFVARLPGRRVKRGVHLYSWDGRLLRSFTRRATVDEVLPHVIEATVHAQGFAKRLADYRATLDRPDLAPGDIASLRRRFAHPRRGVRENAVRDALRTGAPAYRALKPLVNVDLDVETRRLIGNIVRRLEPLARLVKKHRLDRPPQRFSGKAPRGARLAKSRVCGKAGALARVPEETPQR